VSACTLPIIFCPSLTLIPASLRRAPLGRCNCPADTTRAFRVPADIQKQHLAGQYMCFDVLGVGCCVLSLPDSCLLPSFPLFQYFCSCGRQKFVIFFFQVSVYVTDTF
jgi:hypothetical protein